MIMPLVKDVSAWFVLLCIFVVLPGTVFYVLLPWSAYFAAFILGCFGLGVVWHFIERLVSWALETLAHSSRDD